MASIRSRPERSVFLLASCVKDFQNNGAPINGELLAIAVLDRGIILVHEDGLHEPDRECWWKVKRDI